jgi:phosphohistidine phosphatase SixA
MILGDSFTMFFQNREFRLNGIRSLTLSIAFMIIGLVTVPSFANSGDHNHGTPKATIYKHTHVPIETIQLAESLREGGYTIFFRHERTMMTEVLRDRLPYNFSTCDGQRILSSAGIASSQEVGQAFKILNIPIETVLTSPICRSKDTAQLAFKEFKVTNQLMVQNIVMKRTKEEVDRDLKALVNQPHRPKQNVILVGHLGNVMGLKEMPSEGEAIVLKPDGKSGVTVVGRILAAQWGDIVRDIDRAKSASN